MLRAASAAIIILLAATAAAQAPKKKPATPTPAPAPPAVNQKFPIEAIKVTGSKLYPEPAIIAATGLKPGELLDDRRIETARDNLLASGAFTSVAFRYVPAPSQRGYLLTFEVIDLEQLFDYRIERFGVDEAKLRAFLKQREPLFGTRIPGAETVLVRFRAAIAEYLKSQGKPPDVAGRVASDNGQTFVLFSPPGQLPAVATIGFTGNKLIPLTQLQNTIHPVAVGSQFREVHFRELLENAIRPLYDSRGRLRMKFTKIESKPSESVKGLAITVGIDEGESFSFGPVTIQGVPGGEEVLVKAAAIPESEVADMSVVTAAQERIHRYLRGIGHMAVASEVDRQLVDQDRLCRITFKVTPGPPYMFGKLLFQGLDLHGEHEMRRIWTLKPGTVFNGEYPELFVNRVKEDKLFDGLENLRAVTIPDHKALTVDVKLIFNERKPKILQ